MSYRCEFFEQPTLEWSPAFLIRVSTLPNPLLLCLPELIAEGTYTNDKGTTEKEEPA
jgi:hypothetical protein